MERNHHCLTTKELSCSPYCIQRFLVQLLVLHPLSFQPLEGCGDPENTAGCERGLVRGLGHLPSVVGIGDRLVSLPQPPGLSLNIHMFTVMDSSHVQHRIPPGAPDFAPTINPKPQLLVSGLSLGSLKSWRSCCPWMTPEINEQWGLMAHVPACCLWKDYSELGAQHIPSRTELQLPAVVPSWKKKGTPFLLLSLNVSLSLCTFIPFSRYLFTKPSCSRSCLRLCLQENLNQAPGAACEQLAEGNTRWKLNISFS